MRSTSSHTPMNENNPEQRRAMFIRTTVQAITAVLTMLAVLATGAAQAPQAATTPGYVYDGQAATVQSAMSADAVLAADGSRDTARSRELPRVAPAIDPPQTRQDALEDLSTTA
jgi:hypothetical protein